MAKTSCSQGAGVPSLVGEPRSYMPRGMVTKNSEVNKKEKKQILYIQAHLWNLEKWYRWSYLQRRNRNTDVENKCMGTRASLVAQMVKNLPEMQETWVWPLENPLEKRMAIHPSTLAWRISWTEEPGGLQSMGSQTVALNLETNTFTFKEGVGKEGERNW